MVDEERTRDDVSIRSQSSAEASSVGASDATGDSSLDAMNAVSSTANDPADEVPVPPAMSPAEIDERAQVVEALRATDGEARP